MTSIVKFTPLSGAKNEKPLCYLLEIDEFKLLLDCGWDERFDVSELKLLKGLAPLVDGVLLSHPDLDHLGALPYAYGKLGLNCKVYATTPVNQMGQFFMYDALQSREQQEEFDLFSYEDIDGAFKLIVDLKYSQKIELTDKLGGTTGITIEPHQAGHMIGGTIWKITKESEEIVYAVDYNHGKERHLSRSVLETLTRPTLLITESLKARYKKPPRSKVDESMLGAILRTVRNGGNVLIAADTAGRVLELLQTLEHVWSKSDQLAVYKLIFLNNMAGNVAEAAKTLIEFTSKEMQRAFETQQNPFNLHHTKVFRSLEELDATPGQKVVLTSLSGFESGFGRQLFLRWCGDPKNLILHTGTPALGTLGRALADNNFNKNMTVINKRRIPLQGAELAAFRKEKREKKEEEEQERLEALAQEEAMQTDDLDDAHGSDDDDDSKVLLRHDLMAPTSSKNDSGFFKQAKTFDMYPCVDDKINADEYGEIIRVEDYVLEDDFNKQSAREEVVVAPTEVVVPEEHPTKCVESPLTISINSQVAKVDFDGRADGDAYKQVLFSVKPRVLIFIHGNEPETEDMVDHCAENMEGLSGIYDPGIGECINVTSDRKIYQVKLTDTLVTSLKFSQIHEYELAWVNGVIDLPTLDDDMDESDEAAVMAQMPTLNALDKHNVEGHTGVFIGDLRLGDFKPVLDKAGIKAVFSGGMLVCNGTVAVKKAPGQGQLSLEGSVCDTYYAVRDLLYQQFAIV
eukprot:m.149321 g.149321  ORF g.149321 m.149321 type:complete len:741 (+) comp30650_c0_seq1:204-2426(+)